MCTVLVVVADRNLAAAHVPPVHEVRARVDHDLAVAADQRDVVVEAARRVAVLAQLNAASVPPSEVPARQTNVVRLPGSKYHSLTVFGPFSLMRGSLILS